MFKKIISLLFLTVSLSLYSAYEIMCIPVAHIDTYHYKTVGAGLCLGLKPLKEFKEDQWESYLQGDYEDLKSIKEEACLYFLIEGKYKHVIVALAKEWDAYYHSEESLFFKVIYSYTEQEILEILDPLSEQEFKDICKELFDFMLCLYSSLPNSCEVLQNAATVYTSAQAIANIF